MLISLLQVVQTGAEPGPTWAGVVYTFFLSSFHRPAFRAHIHRHALFHMAATHGRLVHSQGSRGLGGDDTTLVRRGPESGGLGRSLKPCAHRNRFPGGKSRLPVSVLIEDACWGGGLRSLPDYS